MSRSLDDAAPQAAEDSHATFRARRDGRPSDSADVFPIQPTRPVSRPDAPAVVVRLQPGQRFGDYVIQQELARGGMGVVYKARQVSLGRVVALKMVLRGPASLPSDVHRFRSEALAIARLHHPNLVSIYEVGEHDGLPFYTMEFLPGGSLSRRLAGSPISPREAARLLLTLARAMHYAHENGVVHRDLKPSNVLLAGDGSPKIADFGIAKLQGENNSLTLTGEVLGTPGYMAPEQASGDGQAGPAADVYSLGAVLFEALTGQPPFSGPDPAAVLLKVVTDDPPRPRQLNPNVPPDLETICLKCLEKEPPRRYASAEALAEDLRRFLADEPILARPASTWEVAGKWARRNPAKVTTLVASLLLLAVGLWSAVVYWREAESRAQVEGHLRLEKEANLREAESRARAESQLRKEKETNLKRVRALLADAWLDRGIALAEKNDVRRGLHWMARALEQAESAGGAGALAEAARYNLAHWGELAARPAVDLPHTNWAWAVALTPDGKTAFTGCADGKFRVWDANTGQLLGQPHPLSGPVWAVQPHPSGRFVFAAGGERQGEVRVFQSDRARAGHFAPLGEPLATPAPVARLGLSPDGKALFALTRALGLSVYRFDLGAKPRLELLDTLANAGAVAAQFSARSRRLFFASRARQVMAYDLRRKAVLDEAWQLDEPITALALLGDGAGLAVTTYSPEEKQSALHLWRFDTGEKKLEALKWSGAARGLVSLPGGRRLAASLMFKDNDAIKGEVHVVDIEADFTATQSQPSLPHDRPVWSMAFLPSGWHLVTGCEDGRSRLFEVASGSLVGAPAIHQGNVTTLGLSADGRRLITADSGGDGRAWAKVQPLPRLGAAFRYFGPNAPLRDARWGREGKRLFGLRPDCSADELHPASGRVLKAIRAPEEGVVGCFVGQCNYTRFQPSTNITEVIDLPTGRAVYTVTGSPGATRVLGGQLGSRMLRYDSMAQKLRLVPQAGGGLPEASVAMPRMPYADHNGPSPFGGPLLAVCSHLGQDGTKVRLLNERLEELRSWEAPFVVGTMRFSPSGKILAVMGRTRTQFLGVRAGKLLGQGLTYTLPLGELCFHPTELIAAFSRRDGTIFHWHVPTSKPVGPMLRYSNAHNFLLPRPDGSGYLAGPWKCRPVQWPHLKPKAGSAAEVKRWVEELTGAAMGDNGELVPLGLAE